MRYDDNRAENILLRLASYTPRVGRNAEEDFCTEALAWCLRKSEDFKIEFLSLLGARLGSLNLKSKAGLQVSTQESFNPGVDEQETDEESTPPESRFDLVLRQPSDWVAVVECKTAEDAGLPEQLRRYRDALNRSKFSKFEQRLLVTLTPGSEPPTMTTGETKLDAHLPWPEVQKLLAEVGQRVSGAPESISAPSFAATMCAQFADFLKEKGMAPMKVREVKPQELLNWMDGIRFREELERILLAARQDPRLRPVLKRKAELGPRNDYECLFLANVQGAAFLCIGFSLTENATGKEQPHFEMFAEGKPGNSWDDGRVKQCGAIYKWGENCGVSRPIDAGMNGQGDKMKDWLVRTALLFL